MKFDLSSKVRVIDCDDINTWEQAFQCIEKMYWHAYGPRAGIPLNANELTPNEERLTRALVERFAYRAFGMKDFRTYHEPISVDCGDHTYVFAYVEPYEGSVIPVVHRVGSARD